MAVWIGCDVACAVDMGMDDSDDDDAAIFRKLNNGGCASAIF